MTARRPGYYWVRHPAWNRGKIWVVAVYHGDGANLRRLQVHDAPSGLPVDDVLEWGPLIERPSTP